MKNKDPLRERELRIKRNLGGSWWQRLDFARESTVEELKSKKEGRSGGRKLGRVEGERKTWIEREERRKLDRIAGTLIYLIRHLLAENDGRLSAYSNEESPEADQMIATDF